MKNNNVKFIFYSLFWIAVMISPIFIKIYFFPSNSESKTEIIEKPLTPRDMKGLDTIRAGDSLYIIRFKIEKVIPDTISNDSQDKYERYNSEEYDETQL
jgi:hypothetical protein